ncbi:MAG: hypothetical protein ACTH2Q_01445 [Propionibacteriaceae bacterium]
MPEDHSPTVASDDLPVSLDTNVIPLGERAWRNILNHAMAVGDEAETTYLEVKSDVDVTTKIGIAKVARFLLSAANRLPKQAARHFHGYAVLVIGVRKDEAVGVNRGVEPHDLENSLRPYLGPQFPGFEFGRIGVDDDREVLFVVAQPPQDGQPIFPCHKEFQGEKGQDNLADGAVYVRGASNSRPARSGELLGLVERARGGGKPPIDMDIQVLGTINRVELVDEVLRNLYRHAENEFNKQRTTPTDAPVSMFPPQLPGFRSQPLSTEERAERLAQWQRHLQANLSKGRERLLGAGLPGTGLRVVSLDRSISRPELIVTFHDCEAFRHRNLEDVRFEQVIKPVLRQENPHGRMQFDHNALQPARGNHPIAWQNRGHNVEVTLTPESFRPNTPWTSDQDDYVIVTRDPNTTSVSVTWTLTEEGNDDVSRDEFEESAGGVVDARELFKRMFLEDE